MLMDRIYKVEQEMLGMVVEDERENIAPLFNLHTTPQLHEEMDPQKALKWIANIRDLIGWLRDVDFEGCVVETLPKDQYVMRAMKLVKANRELNGLANEIIMGGK